MCGCPKSRVCANIFFKVSRSGIGIVFLAPAVFVVKITTRGLRSKNERLACIIRDISPGDNGLNAKTALETIAKTGLEATMEDLESDNRTNLEIATGRTWRQQQDDLGK